MAGAYRWTSAGDPLFVERELSWRAPAAPGQRETEGEEGVCVRQEAGAGSAAGGGSWERTAIVCWHKEKLQGEGEAAADVTEELRCYAGSERSRERNSAGAVTKRGRGERWK